jgi:hypothetical protein
MPHRAHILSRALLALALACAAVAAPALTGCTGAGGTSSGGETSGTVSASIATTPTLPPPWSLKNPENAVVSYLYWISFAYRVANSRVASQTYTPYEEVHVDSYIQYNLQEGRAIEQAPTVLRLTTVSATENTATVRAHEEWTYRYISTKTRTYTTAPLAAAYESTYTVVKGEDGLWRVDSVEASATTPVK